MAYGKCQPFTLQKEMPTPPDSVADSTVDYQSADVQEASHYQVLWDNIMENGGHQRYKAYTAVSVLLLCWADGCDELGVKEEVDALEKTFRERFNFEVHIEYLDTEIEGRLQVRLNAKVADFVCKNDGLKTLLIIYYAGLARWGENHGSLELFGKQMPVKQRRQQDELIWSITENMLLHAEAEVLEIFDCCYAGNLGPTRGERRCFEYLAATQQLGITRRPGKRSFTSALIYALESLVQERSEGRFSTVDLLMRIRQSPDFPKDQIPVLSDRAGQGAPDRILLHPLKPKFSRNILQSNQENVAASTAELYNLTIGIILTEKPQISHIEILGKEMSRLADHDILPIDKIIWGGIKPCTSARVVKRFRATPSRRRLAAQERQGLKANISDSRGLLNLASIEQQSSTPSVVLMTAGESEVQRDMRSQRSCSLIRNLRSHDDSMVLHERAAIGAVISASERLAHSPQSISLRDYIAVCLVEVTSADSLSYGSRYHISYLCCWELWDFVRDELEPDQTLSRVVTLTGTATNAQALICEDYVRQTWPNLGALILQSLEDMLTPGIPAEVAESCKKSLETPLGTSMIELKIDRHLHENDVQRTEIKVTGDLESLKEIAEILAWLTAAVRTSPKKGFGTSTVNFFPQTPTEPGLSTFKIEPGEVEPLQNESSMCWHALFVNGVIATQFPIRDRKEGVGVEISPDLMATLSGVVAPAEFRGGLILKGLSTALIPIKRLEDDGAIQWHLVLTDANTGIIDQNICAETRESQMDFFKAQDLKLLTGNTAYLGWCNPSTILLNTEGFNCRNVTWSDPSEKDKKIELTGFSLGIGSSGIGFGGPSITAQFTIAKSCRTRYMDVEPDLDLRLKTSIANPILIYDTSSQRGWLIPITCALLFMVHLQARARRKWLKDDDNMQLNIPFARLNEEGGREAYNILKSFMNDNVDSSIGSANDRKGILSRLFIALDMALNESLSIKDKVSLVQDSEIYGFELMNIVLAEPPFRFNHKRIQRASGGWAPIMASLGYVLFCSSLGEVIIPGLGANVLCRHWSRVPSGSDYLCAYVPCVLEMLSHEGKHASNQRLRDAVEEDNFYCECHHGETTRCLHLQSYKDITDPPKYGSENSSSSSTLVAVENEDDQASRRAALIFGKSTKVLKDFPKRGLLTDGEHPQPKRRCVRDFFRSVE